MRNGSTTDVATGLFASSAVLSTATDAVLVLSEHLDRGLSVPKEGQVRYRCYSELRRIDTFDERFEYLDLRGQVAEQTFGHARWMNQVFYTSRQWRSVRDHVILRDNGCDLGVPGYEVHHGLLVHHMNPMTVKDIEDGREWILDPEFLICTSKRTHNAIHYGSADQLPRGVVERKSGDTKLW